MTIAGLVLAAGEGARHGGPKALVREGDRTWLETAVRLLFEGGCDPVVVVLGAEAGAARAGVDVARAEAGLERAAVGPTDPTSSERLAWVTHETWAAGRTGSLQAGLRALSTAVGGVVVHAVDFPGVLPRTVRILVEAATEASPAILLPVHAGRRGHPILLGRATWNEILALGPDEPLRTVIRRDPGRVREVWVNDPAIHDNRNEPAPHPKEEPTR
jgi:nicotine blue oxidoreductase